MMRSLKVKEPTERFSVQRTMQGFEVIDKDGRPITASMPKMLAQTTSNDLNFAAYVGRKNLAAVLVGEAEIS